MSRGGPGMGLGSDASAKRPAKAGSDPAFEATAQGGGAVTWQCAVSQPVFGMPAPSLSPRSSLPHVCAVPLDRLSAACTILAAQPVEAYEQAKAETSVCENRVTNNEPK